MNHRINIHNALRLPVWRLSGLTVFLCLAGCSVLRAESSPWMASYLLSYPRSALVAVKEPFQWKKADWLKAGGVVLISGGLYLADEELRDLFQRNQSDELDLTVDVVRQFGEIKYMLPAAGVTAMTGYVLDSPKTADTGLLSLKALLIAGATTRSLQLLTQRQRPFKEEGHTFWNGTGIKWGRDSFPSGHSTVAWTVAPIIAYQYSDQAWLPPVVYSLAALTSLSRVYEDKHWSSDVFAGAVVGMLAARLTLVSTPRLSVTPCVNQPGITMIYSF